MSSIAAVSGPTPKSPEQSWGAGRDQRRDQLVQAGQLVLEELGAAAKLAQRQQGVVADHAAGPGPQRGQLGDQPGGGLPGEPGADVARAVRLATISARIASTWPSRPRGDPDARPDRAALAALTASSGPGLALAAPVLPVRAVHPGDPDPSRGDMTGQPGAVAAGALDPDQADRAEAPQPAQEPGVPGRRRRELPHPEQPADAIQRRRHMVIGVRVHAAGHRARFIYDGQRHPFRR
jgi:hypothetical protein